MEIVITSLAARSSETGLLNRFERLFPKGPKPPRRVGDVQFRPFDEEGPVDEKNKKTARAVTLFELEDYLHMTHKQGKDLVLIAGPNPDNSLKTEALLPLVANEGMRLWTHLCLDIDTAEDLVEKLKK